MELFSSEFHDDVLGFQSLGAVRMGFEYMSLVRVKSVLLMAGAAFALVLFAPHFDLQHVKSLSSLFSAGEVRDKSSSWDSLIYDNSSRNSTYSSGLNATNVNVADLVSTNTEVSDDMVSEVSVVKDDSDPENIEDVDDTLDDGLDPEDEFPFSDFLEINNNLTVLGVFKDNSSTVENSLNYELPVSNYTSKNDSLRGHDVVIDAGALPPSSLQFLSTSAENFETNPSNYVNSTYLNTSKMGKDEENTLTKNESPTILREDLSNLVNDSSISSISVIKERVKEPKDMVVPISQMNDMLLRSYASYKALKPRWSSAVDQELRNVKSLIESAAIIEKDYRFDVSLYRNFSAFKRSYELMEQVLKVYVYAEGERPIFHQPPLQGIYASEGWFMKQLKSNKQFVTKNAKKAHLFYFPFSSFELRIALYVPNSHKHKNLIQRLSDYLDMIKTKYYFWNRTDGADHFLVACHDWAPGETRNIMANCIRSLCNSDIEGFRFGKDVSLPETYVTSTQNPLRQLGGKPSSQRRILAFFAGNMHGYLRPILLNYWENKDPDMKIFGPLPKAKGKMTYAKYMKSSKYCICAKGYEVNSPRVVEAIFYECVPVIISDNFVPPFFETLRWESFAVFVLEKDIPNLKTILLSISKTRYKLMQQRVKRVQQHFLWHSRPVKYDVFNMILHSIWHNRVFRT